MSGVFHENSRSLCLTFFITRFPLNFLYIFFMYPYHNKIKQRIRNRELVKYEYVDKYKDISPCLLLYFNTDPNLRPIRKHKFEEYQALLDDYTI
jgi:hypothetical protein